MQVFFINYYAVSEFLNHNHFKVVSKLGFTPSDIVYRPVVAVGYTEGELLPPYESRIHSQRARSILNYLRASKNKIPISSVKLDIEPTFISSNNVIEVVGGLAGWCVPNAVKEIIGNGSVALVDARKILHCYKRGAGFAWGNNNTGIGEVVKTEVREIFNGEHIDLTHNVTLFYNQDLLNQH